MFTSNSRWVTVSPLKLVIADCEGKNLICCSLFQITYVRSCVATFFRKITLAIFGLDNAGKTLTTKGLTGGRLELRSLIQF